VNSGDKSASIDELLDRAVTAFNRGDRAAVTALAGQILALDQGNPEAEDLLAFDQRGEIRRLTMMFDRVGRLDGIVQPRQPGGLPHLGWQLPRGSAAPDQSPWGPYQFDQG
jgi:hypothetical protein